MSSAPRSVLLARVVRDAALFALALTAARLVLNWKSSWPGASMLAWYGLWGAVPGAVLALARPLASRRPGARLQLAAGAAAFPLALLGWAVASLQSAYARGKDPMHGLTLAGELVLYIGAEPGMLLRPYGAGAAAVAVLVLLRVRGSRLRVQVPAVAATLLVVSVATSGPGLHGCAYLLLPPLAWLADRLPPHGGFVSEALDGVRIASGQEFGPCQGVAVDCRGGPEGPAEDPCPPLASASQSGPTQSPPTDGSTNGPTNGPTNTRGGTT